MHRTNLPRRITAQATILLGLLVGTPADAASTVDCGALRESLDASVREGGAFDTRHVRSASAPWLRRDAFLAAELRRAEEAGDRPAAATIVQAMAELDGRGLALELGPQVASEPAVAACHRDAVERLLAAPARLRAVAREPLPAPYVGWRRLLGGYIFVRPFLRIGAARWRAGERAAIAQGLPAPRLIHRPTRSAAPMPQAVAMLLRDLRVRHALGWPEPDAAALDQLGRAFAPELATNADVPHARVGRLLGQGGRPVVDGDAPLAYLEHGLVRWGSHVLLQLSYTFWFTKRPREHPLDPYGGAIDGLVLRATIADDGRVLLWESIHPCGCFYTLALPADRELRYLPGDPAELEAPLLLDGPAAGARIRASYSADEHSLRAVSDANTASPPAAEIVRYELVPYERLLANTGARPPFGRKGLLRGSERLERLFLWPSGIRSPGAMRTSGRHATAFLGRRRFDAADLVGGRLRRLPTNVHDEGAGGPAAH